MNKLISSLDRPKSQLRLYVEIARGRGYAIYPPTYDKEYVRVRRVLKILLERGCIKEVPCPAEEYDLARAMQVASALGGRVLGVEVRKPSLRDIPIKYLTKVFTHDSRHEYVARQISKFVGLSGPKLALAVAEEIDWRYAATFSYLAKYALTLATALGQLKPSRELRNNTIKQVNLITLAWRLAKLHRRIKNARIRTQRMYDLLELVHTTTNLIDDYILTQIEKK